MAACVTAAVFAFCVAAEAAPQRFVASTGNDANNCAFANPCRTLQRAVDVSLAGGMVVVLDSSGYGQSLTITKSVTVIADGVTATLGNPGNITINAAGAVVSLRGLTLKGQPGGSANGISIVAAAAVHIERCVVHGFWVGIFATAGGVEVFVSDSIARDNGDVGFFIGNTGTSQVTIDDSRFENNAHSGVWISSGNAAISRSTASHNALVGIALAGSASVSVVSTMAAYNGNSGFGFGAPSNGATMTVESSVAHDNLVGLVVEPGDTARISNSTFAGNAIGIHNKGTVETRQNNTVSGNTNANLSGNALTPFGGT